MKSTSQPDIRRMKANRDVSGLIRALRDQEDVSLRSSAATALGQLRDARAVAPLIAAFRNVPFEAAEALGRIGDARAVKSLVALLHDENQTIRHHAGGALKKLRWQPTQDETGARYCVAIGDWDQCTKIGQPAEQPLIQALAHNDSGRDGAARALAAVAKAKAVGPLIRALQREQGLEDFTAVAEELGKLKAKRAVEPLFRILVAPRQLAWKAGVARRALVSIGAPAVEVLVEYLSYESWGDQPVRGPASEVLGEIGAPAVEALLKQLNAKNAGVRRAAAWALGKTGDRRAVQPLIAALRSEDHQVCQGAADSLRRLQQAGKLDAADRRDIQANQPQSDMP
jgi:HEAT repeat protein